jgi:hypothetical protein
MKKKKAIKRLWVMFYQQPDDTLHWYPLHNRRCYRGEMQTRRDYGCHTFSLVCIKHYR